MWLSRSAAATLFVALVAFATLARAQTSSPSPVAGLTPLQVAAIDRIAETVIERKATPSVAIGVAKAGRLVFAKAYGYRNLDDRVPADPDTAYGIGSNTKQFTAACILMLRDQGNLDDRVPADPDTAYGIGSNTKQFTAACILMLRDQGKLDVDARMDRAPIRWSPSTVARRHRRTNISCGRRGGCSSTSSSSTTTASWAAETCSIRTPSHRGKRSYGHPRRDAVSLSLR
jgi:CubicO group peptidase (beta-lactamase class C family)